MKVQQVENDMDQRIIQDESPESRPNLRGDDGVTFIYSRDRGIYEPYEHAKEDRDAQSKDQRRPLGGRLAKFWRQHWAGTISNFIAFLGLIVLGLYTYYARQQVCETREAVREAHDSVTTASKSMNLDERAWVSVYAVQPGPKGNRPTVSVFFENKGRTPAKGFSVIGGFGYSVNSPENRLSGNGIIAPAGTFHSDIVSDASQGKQVDLFVHGAINYASVFGNSHWTKFCYRQVPNTKFFTPCEIGNDIDSNDP